MNDWALAEGADTIAMVATVAAINFDFMNGFSLGIWPESGRLRALGQPMPSANRTAGITGVVSRDIRPKLRHGTSCHVSPNRPQCAAIKQVVQPRPSGDGLGGEYGCRQF